MPTATVLSICPFETAEEKPIARGHFKIPAAPKDDFILVYIVDSSYIQRLPATDHNITIPVSAHSIAKSLVDDFINTVVEATAEAGPGMMWFENKITREDVLNKYADELKALEERQLQWFKNLCRLADDDWNQYHRIGLISGHQRYAAQYLNHKAPWLTDYSGNVTFIDCPACFSRIDSRAAICINCKAIINKAKATEFGLIPSIPEVAGKK